MRHDAFGPTYTVHLQRPGFSYEVSGPTLTEAYAAAARRIREPSAAAPHGGPHFPRGGEVAPPTRRAAPESRRG